LTGCIRKVCPCCEYSAPTPSLLLIELRSCVIRALFLLFVPCTSHNAVRLYVRSRSICYPTKPLSSRQRSSLALKVGARREEGDALVHDGLAYPQVVFDPSLDTGGIAELLWFNTDTVRPPSGRRAHVSRGAKQGDSGSGDVKHAAGRGEAGGDLREAGGAADASEEGGHCGRQPRGR
jgi:hypothetical protein